MTLLEECIEVLKPQVQVLSLNQGKDCAKLISDNFPIQINGRIDWEKTKQKKKIHDYFDIINYFKTIFADIDETVYVFWARADLPVIQTILPRVIQYIDDVLAVGFDDAWIISKKHRFVIEFYHNGDITIGFF